MLNLHNELKQNVKQKGEKKEKKRLFTPRSWKYGTLRTILLQAYKFCSSVVLLGKELKN